jgi:hypothetical protein
MAATNQLKVVAVVDEQDGAYKGVISIRDTVVQLATSYATQNKGSILVLSMDYYDYTLSKICRWIEENDARVLSTYVDADPRDSSKIRLTIKIDKEDLSHIVATLERFNYKVEARFENEPTTDWTQERLDLLFRFMDL